MSAVDAAARPAGVRPDGDAADVGAYAAAVRVALADLGPEQVEELTDGLEADLAEAWADEDRHRAPDLVGAFGTPWAYARDLRAAAGLAPERSARGPRGALRTLRIEVRRLPRDLRHELRSTRWWPEVEDAATSLRPAWWLLRGWAFAQLVVWIATPGNQDRWWLPAEPLPWAVLVVAVVASVQLGRGRWAVGRRWRPLLRGVSAVCAVVGVGLLVYLPAVQRSQVEGYEERLAQPPSDGVVVAGRRATNLFVYDAQGLPVPGAQVVDQAGDPVLLDETPGAPWDGAQIWTTGADEPSYAVAATGPDGERRWNVFPLHTLTESGFRWADDGSWVPRTDAAADVRPPTWPAATLPPVDTWADPVDGAAP